MQGGGGRNSFPNPREGCVADVGFIPCLRKKLSTVSGTTSLPQVFVANTFIGDYEAVQDLHDARGMARSHAVGSIVALYHQQTKQKVAGFLWNFQTGIILMPFFQNLRPFKAF